MKTLNIQTKDERKGLDVHSIPFIYFVFEDKSGFNYSEIGIISGCRFYEAEEFLNPIYHNKFVLSVQYDYRSADDLNNFGFVPNTGTYGETFFCDSLEDAMQKNEEFLNSVFTDYKTFRGEFIPQTNKATIREVAEAQSLHHTSSYERLYTEENIYHTIIVNAGKEEKLKQYIAINKNRANAERKYLNKVESRFLNDFGFKVWDVVHNWRFYLTDFKNKAGVEDFKQLTKRQQKTAKTALKLFNF